jgi:hypothetical protein
VENKPGTKVDTWHGQEIYGRRIPTEPSEKTGGATKGVHFVAEIGLTPLLNYFLWGEIFQPVLTTRFLVRRLRVRGMKTTKMRTPDQINALRV